MKVRISKENNKFYLEKFVENEGSEKGEWKYITTIWKFRLFFFELEDARAFALNMQKNEKVIIETLDSSSLKKPLSVG